MKTSGIKKNDLEFVVKHITSSIQYDIPNLHIIFIIIIFYHQYYSTVESISLSIDRPPNRSEILLERYPLQP